MQLLIHACGLDRCSISLRDNLRNLIKDKLVIQHIFTVPQYKSSGKYFYPFVLFLVPPDAECWETWDHLEGRYTGGMITMYKFGTPAPCIQACVDDSLCRIMVYEKLNDMYV